ncbi:sugar transferase [Luteitalea sp. TBR-22]|uniref:sugar transferase n=1 Tax=Luteitalea sp. TBR-22 TaxID=2802971 RepID=UPI001EF57434|nr:sugar transferase [Luteitalea sp. TBR-22]
MSATHLKAAGRVERVTSRPGSAGQPDAYILGQAVLRQALVRERKRAERQGLTFAVLVIDRSHLAAGEADWAPIVRAAVAARRNEDAVGWLEDDAVLAVIVPDATRDTTHALGRRLRQHVATSLGEAGDALSTRLYVHGPDSDDFGGHLPSVDLLIEAFIQSHRPEPRDVAKRALDIVGSLALLALFSPVMLLAYLAVKFTSRGPALFRQVRIGRRGEPFEMLKFRSMRTDMSSAIHQEYVTWFITQSGKQERTGTEVFKLTADPRITKVGHWLRKTSLDELPQFINVLRGDMSLVGPRPPLPFEVDKYQPWHRRRVLDAKPGITGLWQVKGRSRTTFDEMVRMDLEYARTRSLWADVKIIAATPLAMVKGAM